MEHETVGPATLPLAVIRAGVPPGKTILDLGAHTGTVAIPAAEAGYRVMAVEASPQNVERLLAAVVSKGLDRLFVLQTAVTDHQGEVDFLEDGAQGHITDAATSGTVRIPATTVDELWARNGYPDVDFVKLDLEGGEVAALRGMSDLLASSPPPPLLCESNGPRLAAYGETPNTLLTLLARRGYRCYLAQPGRLVPVDPDDLQPSCVVDYLAVHKLDGTWKTWLQPPMSEQECQARIDAELRSQDPEKRAWIEAALRDAGG